MEGNPLWIFHFLSQLHHFIPYISIGLLFPALFSIRERLDFPWEGQHSSANNSAEKDIALWDSFKGGCLDSYERIYRENVQHLFNYGITIVPNDSLIKDCIQELFFEIWKARKNLSPTNNIRYYLLKSLRYKVQHARVKEEKMKSIALQSYSNQSNILFPFEDELIKGQDICTAKKKLENALNKLSSRQKEVITLIFFEGMTYEEVANVMSISVGSIYTLAWKAISRLKKSLI